MSSEILPVAVMEGRLDEIRMLSNTRPWSDDEDERLKQMLLAGKLRGDLAQALGRSKDATARRKAKLKHEGKWPAS